MYPFPGEIEEARRNPGGWVYRIAGSFGPHEADPPEAIVCAWRVGPAGTIDGQFMANPKYDEVRFPG